MLCSTNFLNLYLVVLSTGPEMSRSGLWNAFVESFETKFIRLVLHLKSLTVCVRAPCLERTSGGVVKSRVQGVWKKKIGDTMLYFEAHPPSPHLPKKAITDQSVLGPDRVGCAMCVIGVSPRCKRLIFPLVIYVFCLILITHSFCIRQSKTSPHSAFQTLAR